VHKKDGMIDGVVAGGPTCRHGQRLQIDNNFDRDDVDKALGE
jgi:hypothetical protein